MTSGSESLRDTVLTGAGVLARRFSSIRSLSLPLLYWEGILRQQILQHPVETFFEETTLVFGKSDGRANSEKVGSLVALGKSKTLELCRY